MIFINYYCDNDEYDLQKGSEGSAAFDLKAKEGGSLNPGSRTKVESGIHLALSDQYYAEIRPRSGLAIKHGITILNTPGTIDSDYRGDISMILYNTSDTTFYWEKGDRLAQLSFHCKSVIQLINDKDAVLKSKTNRDEKGFGSTGK